jgi:SAM-dependent methyltransferase
MPHLDEAKQRQGETWSLGDYWSLGSRLTIVGELLCEAADVRSGWALLDIGTGPGNTALAAARRGCRVTGVDISEVLLGIAAQRARCEGLDIDFLQADAEALPFDDASFDAVTSSFAVMFTPTPERAAEEMSRVCRRGGVMALANWASTGANAIESAIIARYAGGEEPASPWSTREGLEGLLGGAVEDFAVTERSLRFRFPSVAAYVETSLNEFGPFMRLAEQLSEEDLSALRSELIEALSSVNESGDETMVIPYPYLEAVARRR